MIVPTVPIGATRRVHWKSSKPSHPFLFGMLPFQSLFLVQKHLSFLSLRNRSPCREKKNLKWIPWNCVVKNWGKMKWFLLKQIDETCHNILNKANQTKANFLQVMHFPQELPKIFKSSRLFLRYWMIVCFWILRRLRRKRNAR